LRKNGAFLRWFERNRALIDALVLDIDGVLLLRGKPLSGSGELLALLRREAIPFSLMTNAANISIEARCQQFQREGLPVVPADIVSSGHTLEDYIHDQGYMGQLFFLMGELGDPCYAEQAGLRTTKSFEELYDCAGVLVGEGKYDWQKTINRVINFFVKAAGQGKRSKPPLIVPNPDRLFPAGDGEIRIASGGISRLIEEVLSTFGVEIDTVYLGKPYTPIFRYNHSYLEERANRSLALSRVLMLGDTLEGDIEGARRFGYLSALMLTGATSEKRLEAWKNQPDYVFVSL
jgi:HAD superfamily hydrolase (TIGR01450 family)